MPFGKNVVRTATVNSRLLDLSAYQLRIAKADFAKAYRRFFELSLDRAQKALEKLPKGFTGRVSKWGVALPGFGMLVLRVSKARRGRNPKTGARMEIAARPAVAFRPSSTLKGKLPSGK